MALQGSASANLSPILFKGNNRPFAINLIIHQDQSGSMTAFSDFYSSGSFIGTLQNALIGEGIGVDVNKYPNLYGYFNYRSRNPSSSFLISNREGDLTISQSFIRGESTGSATITNWTSNYFNNVGSIVNICTNIIGATDGGRLDTLTNFDADDRTEDVHGNLFSIYTTPNAVSTGTPGIYGSIISSSVRKNTTTIVITNSDEQSGAPLTLVNNTTGVGIPVDVGGTPELITNGTFNTDTSGWISFNSSVNTWIGGQMRILRQNASNQTTYQTFTTVVGQTYRVSAVIISPSGNRGDLQIRNGSGWAGTLLLSLAGTAGATVTVTGLFTATSTTTTLGFLVSDNNEFITVDNVSVRSTRTINGLSGEMIFREYRIIALSSYTSSDGYVGVLFYGDSFSQPYGYVSFPTTSTFTITRSATPPNWTRTTSQLHNTIDLARITRGALFKIGSVYTGGGADNRTAFSNCLTEFLRTTL